MKAYNNEAWQKAVVMRYIKLLRYGLLWCALTCIIYGFDVMIDRFDAKTGIFLDK